MSVPNQKVVYIHKRKYTGNFLQIGIEEMRLARQYTIKARKRLIFKDFLGLLRAIYYPFTTFENLKN